MSLIDWIFLWRRDRREVQQAARDERKDRREGRREFLDALRLALEAAPSEDTRLALQQRIFPFLGSLIDNLAAEASSSEAGVAATEVSNKELPADDEEAAINLATEAFEAGRLRLGVQYLQEALITHPESIPLRLVLARALELENKFEQAVEELDKARTAENDLHLSIQMLRPLMMIAMHDPSKAHAAFRRAISVLSAVIEHPMASNHVRAVGLISRFALLVGEGVPVLARFDLDEALAIRLPEESEKIREHLIESLAIALGMPQEQPPPNG